MDQSQAGQRLLEVIREIAEGHYSDRIMELTRPEVPEPLRTVAEAMGLMMVKVEAREYRLGQLIEQLEELNQRIRQATIATVSAMANALAARNAYTEGHASRVGELAGATARELGLVEEEAQAVRLGGLLHDIGKIGFSDRLFEDHGQKNPPELVKIILRHPEVGYGILRGLDFLGPALDFVRCHHERLDGSGYPRHLKAPDIPRGALIIAAADGYDAMTTDRPYQQGMDQQTALANLRKQCPHRLDAEVVEALARVVRCPDGQ
ncbi:MAG: HD domain-containing protein [Desulfarculus sp.]|nr:HD domain-containing protein [Desulfarculus sp.]